MEKSTELISFICPTRLRPNNVHRLIESTVSNFSGKGRLDFHFYIDDDDEVSKKYFSTTMELPRNIRVLPHIGSRITMCEMSNILARKSDEGILFFCGDDIVIESRNWDIPIKSQFNKIKDKILLVYGDDGIMHESLATHFFVHTKWVRTLGYIVPPLFTGDWVDNYVTSVATKLNRKVYLPNVKTTHMHPTVGKAAYDSVYIEKYQRDVISNPQKIFNDCSTIIESNVCKLQRIINETA